MKSMSTYSNVERFNLFGIQPPPDPSVASKSEYGREAMMLPPTIEDDAEDDE